VAGQLKAAGLTRINISLDTLDGRRFAHLTRGGEIGHTLRGVEKALEAQLKAAQELVDLLTTKMNALRQQYEAQDAMVPGYVIQQQMDETGQRLARAQAQEARIRAEMSKRV
jgi:molybdenum cofactor biosynthesis enzyme MoaA